MKYVPIVLLLLAFGPLKAQMCTARLSGHVHHSSIHDNLPGAVVTLQPGNKTAITNERGDFVFDSLCAGSYTLVVSHVEYDPVERTVQLSASQHVDIDLPRSKDILRGVTVTAQRSLSNTGMKQDLGGQNLEETRGQSLAEALSKVNGVSMLQTGANISKPVIHGLHGNRILTINNGVRQQGQQWGNEHAPEIDPFIAGRLTVIKGVDELRYGSDAIGGVILVEPKALRSTPGNSAELNSQYATNNGQYVFSGVWEEQLRKIPSLTYRLQGTFKKSGNVATPHYRLNNTGLQEGSFSATAAWRREHFSTELFYSFFNTELGIFKGAHIGNLTDLLNAIASPRPDPVFTGEKTYRIDRPYQDVTHQLVKSKTAFDRAGHRFALLLAAQKNDRNEFDILRNNSNSTKPQLDLAITTLSQELTWEHPKKKAFHGIAGLSAVQQRNAYGGRYIIPAYKEYNWGAYWIEKWNKNRWDAQAGVRYDHKTINTNRLANGTTFSHNSFKFATLGSSLNVGYRLTEHWKANANLGLASRAPHVNELLSDGIHHGTATYEEGNIDLEPEHAFNISVNTTYTNKEGTLSFEGLLYRNAINNFIYQQPVPEEPVLTIAGAFPKIRHTQTNALFNGADFSFTIKPIQWLEWSTRYAILRAHDRTADDWLIGMPSDRIQNEITFYLKDRKRWSQTYLSLEAAHVAQQKRIPDERGGAIDYKVPPDAYTLFHAHLSTTVQVNRFPIVVGISGRNLLNTAYRDYLNSMRYFTDEPGRNLQVRLKIPFEHFY